MRKTHHVGRWHGLFRGRDRSDRDPQWRGARQRAAGEVTLYPAPPAPGQGSPHSIGISMVSTALKAAPPLLAITATIRQQVFAITQPSSVRKRRQGLGVMAMLDIISTQLANGARRVLAARTARRLIKQQDGAAAVEFALVAAAF